MSCTQVNNLEFKQHGTGKETEKRYNAAMLLEEKIAKLLTRHKKTLSVAESCTGGHLADLLTNVPGASAYFRLGIIVYHDDAKIALLKISPSLLKKHGAVSQEVALRMARNVRKINGTDFGIAITGIAGPTGNTIDKPIGLTYIGVATRKNIFCYEYFLKGDRVQIKRQAAREALKRLLKLIHG